MFDWAEFDDGDTRGRDDIVYGVVRIPEGSRYIGDRDRVVWVVRIGRTTGSSFQGARMRDAFKSVKLFIDYGAAGEIGSEGGALGGRKAGDRIADVWTRSGGIRTLVMTEGIVRLFWSALIIGCSVRRGCFSIC